MYCFTVQSVICYYQVGLLLGITFINRFYKFSETNLPKEIDFTFVNFNVRLLIYTDDFPQMMFEQISSC